MTLSTERPSLAKVSLVAVTAMLFSLIAAGSAHAVPVISVQPASKNASVAGSVSLSVTAVGTGLTYQWRKGTTDLTDAPGFSVEGKIIGDVLGATTDTLTIASLTSAAFGSDYTVVVREGVSTVTSQTVSIIPPAQGPYNAVIGNSASGINNSAFVALQTGLVPTGQVVSATADGASVQVYQLPIVGKNPITNFGNATFWIVSPPGVSYPFNVVATWSGGSSSLIPVSTSPVAGSSLTVSQVSPGSTSITVEALTPKFPRLVEPLVTTPYVTAVYIFDADTGAVIEPTRPGVSNTVSGSQLRMVDPLVLPSSALGKRIRAGFVIWFYDTGYDGGSEFEGVKAPLRYAALSEPITMQTAGGGGDSAGGGGAPEPEPSASPVVSPVTPTPEPPRPAQAVAAPEIPNPAVVTAQEIASFTPEQVALIPPAEFRQLPPAAIGALSPQQVSALTPAQVNSLRPARAAAITPTAVAAMSPVQLEALRPAAVRALPAQTLAALDGPQLASLRPDAVARITPRALRALSPAQLRSLTSEQRERLTPRQLRALDPLQRAALT